MIVHRFMSMREYDALMRGETLRNNTRHADGGKKSTSVGFCFFQEDPDEAIHWLSFLVDADICVTMQIPDDLLTVTQGRYRDIEKDEGADLFDDVPTIWRTEYCLSEYSLRTVKVLATTTRFEPYGRIPDGASLIRRLERLRRVVLQKTGAGRK